MDNIHLIHATAGNHYLVGTDVVTVKATGQETSSRMLVLMVTVPPGGGPPLHHRHAYAETFYFLEGDFVFTTVDTHYCMQSVRAQAGDTLAITSMTWHNFRNEGSTPGRFLVIHSPAIMEDFLREFGQPVEDPLHPPLPAGPPSKEQTQRLMEQISKYMEFLPSDKIIQ